MTVNMINRIPLQQTLVLTTYLSDLSASPFAATTKTIKLPYATQSSKDQGFSNQSLTLSSGWDRLREQIPTSVPTSGGDSKKSRGQSLVAHNKI